jgi:integrase
LPDPLADELREHQRGSASRRLAAQPGAEHATDLVFTASTGGLIDPRRDNQEWNDLLAAAGVRRVRLHDARHTAATLLLLQGVDIRTLMSIMGWTEMATAQRYTHAVDELRRRAANSMGDALWASVT